MDHSKLRLGLSACVAILLLGSVVKGFALAARDDAPPPIYAQIERMRSEGDVAGIVAKIAEYEQIPPASRDEEYYRVVVELCNALSSSNNLPAQYAGTTRSVALGALQAAGTMPIRWEVALLGFLQWDPDYDHGQLGGADWEKERATRAKRWFTALKRLRSERQSAPPPSGRIQLNVSPPPGSGIMDNEPPEGIKDPILRKEYEEALAKNEENYRRSNLERELKDLDESFAPKVTRYITQAYSKPPYANQKLEQLLNESTMVPAERAALLETVQKNIAAREERQAALPKQGVLVVMTESSRSSETAHRADPRLQKPVTFDAQQPKLDDLLARLREATGVRLDRDDGVLAASPVRGSVSYLGVPAWRVMDQIAAAEQVAGRWRPAGDGYRLEPNGSPAQIPQPRPALIENSAAEEPLPVWRRLFTLGPLAVLAGVGAILYMAFRRRSAAS